MTRDLSTVLIWAIVVMAIAAPVVFRDRWWVRLLSVVVLIWFGGVVLTGVAGSARLASETAHRDSIEESEDFGRGARASRDAAVSMMPLFGAVLGGLSLLALLPLKPRK